MKFKDFKVLSAEELIEKAFRRASKIKVRNIKEMSINRISTFSNVVVSHLDKIIEGFSLKFETPLKDFYKELVDVLVGIDKIEKNIKSIKWLKEKIRSLEKEYRIKIKFSEKKNEIYRHRKAFYGRAASIIRDFDEVLRFLEEARVKLEDLPRFKDEFTVVIAGAPNVGKSSLLKALTKSEPKIESYPFTTKKILIGYLKMGYKEYQIIDTPGLLDRPISERNEIEKQAILAIKHLADLIIFVFDASTTCGYSVNEQIAIYQEIRRSFKKPIIVAYNKIDILDDLKYTEFFENKIVFCSAKEGIGIEEIAREIENYENALKNSYNRLLYAGTQNI